MFFNTSQLSRLVTMFCGSLLFLGHALSVAEINPDSLMKWNSLCNSTQHINLCKDDRLYIFPSNNQKKTFNRGRQWCKSLAPCEELGDLISIRNCDQLNDIVNLTNRFINKNAIVEADVQVWTSKLRDLEHEQNLVSSCQKRTKFDPQSIIESNYSILEVETPRIFVRNTEMNEETDKNYQSQLGYVLCEILKPTTESICKKIVEQQHNKSECFVYPPTSKPPLAPDHFNWSSIDEMLNQKRNVGDILKKIDEKIDSLMENGSILNLMTTIRRLNDNAKAGEFEKDNKRITSTMVKIFSTTLEEKHAASWNKINYTERKNASMQIIVQMNKLIEENFCLLKDNETFDINPSSNPSQHKNRLKSPNILLEAFKLNDNGLASDFGFPSELSFNLIQLFRDNQIYFPEGLNLDEIDLSESEIKCESMVQKTNFATGVIYKNLAEYLHHNRSSDKKLIDLIPSSNIDEEFEFVNESDVNSTDYWVRTFKSEEGMYDDHLLNSELVAFTFNNIVKRSVKLRRPVRVLMEHKANKKRLDMLKCVFWNFTSKDWSADGCNLVYYTKSYSICECDHLTNFAILMDVSGREQDSPVKSALSMLCSILSIIGLLITIIVFTFIPKLKSKRNLITANLCVNLLIVNILVAFFMEVESEVPCRIISIVLFYFLTNSFCWMFIQGYFLYQMIVLVFSNVGYFRLKHMILYCNGFSMLWLAVVLAIIGPNGFYDSESSYFCWFSDRNQLQNIWYFLAPVIAICIFNLVIIVLSFKETYKANKRRINLSHVPKPILTANSYLEFSSKSIKSSSKNSSTSTMDSEVNISKVKSWFRGWITLMLLLGLTWIVGFLMIIDVYQIASYVFILLNSLQGFYIFLFEVCLNMKSRSTIIKLLRDKLVVHYLIITSKENQQMTTSQRTTSSTITPISGLTSINDSCEISSVYVNRINTLNSTFDTRDKPTKSRY